MYARVRSYILSSSQHVSPLVFCPPQHSLRLHEVQYRPCRLSRVPSIGPTCSSHSEVRRRPLFHIHTARYWPSRQGSPPNHDPVYYMNLGVGRSFVASPFFRFHGLAMRKGRPFSGVALGFGPMTGRRGRSPLSSSCRFEYRRYWGSRRADSSRLPISSNLPQRSRKSASQSPRANSVPKLVTNR
jgi:hypothetical protein